MIVFPGAIYQFFGATLQDLPSPADHLAREGRHRAWLESSATMPHLVLVDGDDSFRELLGLNLIDEGYQITSFARGCDALAYLEGRGTGDVVLLDWRMPDISGLEVLRRLRRAGITTPVIFLSVLSDDFREEAALERGAVDFIVKSRRLSILLRRLELIAKGTRPTIYPVPWRTNLIRLGLLELRFDTNRALWAGRVIDLTLTEFKIVTLLAEKAGQDVGYREIYDLVHGSNFISGRGGEGYRANVRHFIKRIRKKFCDSDPGFDEIENYYGFGYRWIPHNLHLKFGRFAP